MEDPIRRHPTRAEQLDILVSAVADVARPGEAVLDLGCGTGYLGHLLHGRRPDLRYAGFDRKGDSLAAAAGNLAPWGANARLVEGDLARIAEATGLDGPWRAILSVLTFHDLDDQAKAGVIAWASGRLAPGGFFLLLDRIRLTEPALFPLQRSLWRRLERIHGEGMRAAEDFAAYERDLGTDNRPATLADYAGWFGAAGLAFQPLHLHGNIAVLAGAAKA
ncbi:trans-aconitate 2-methyltransferase [Stella sp.]|uniref:class I SAM-dependent methyltransferase n=1 Tax=Stella sp. TaxID=2912054 RepID=UPI0035B49C54